MGWNFGLQRNCDINWKYVHRNKTHNLKQTQDLATWGIDGHHSSSNSSAQPQWSSTCEPELGSSSSTHMLGNGKEENTSQKKIQQRLEYTTNGLLAEFENKNRHEMQMLCACFHQLSSHYHTCIGWRVLWPPTSHVFSFSWVSAIQGDIQLLEALFAIKGEFFLHIKHEKEV